MNLREGETCMGSVGERKLNLIPIDKIGEFDVRPGFYEIYGATAIPGGVNFTVHSNQATSCELLLFRREQTKPYAIIKFPKHYRIGNLYSMIVFQIDIEEFEYVYRFDGPYDERKGLIFNKKRNVLDPYAKAVTGQSVWGHALDDHSFYKARVVRDDFDWGITINPNIPMNELIIYELHVRGFTYHESSGVNYPGTYRALMKKIPYLKELGINAVELMPIFEFDELLNSREYEGEKLLDYWGYNTVAFFAPNTGYSANREYNREGNELKSLIKAFKENGIEVILDVVFNHTAEGNEDGPAFSFKGLDNNIYYMLTPEGYYYNFSGCGNTLNCNHPIVQQMILDCLRYWVTSYRVDGFRFDLASILGRNEDGSPMSKPPLLQSLAFDPILGKVKLIAEAWDAGGLYQVGTFPSWNRWAEWNGRYRDDLRGFLKGDNGYIEMAANRIAGSRDIYKPDRTEKNVPVNFLTCHDGFTLYDLYSYNEKHNEKNGWNNTDGSNNNLSWNCGVEGETDKEDVVCLRKKMIKNAITVLMCSRGTPMFLAGDEFCNTQFGNNNAYCQDNIVSWLDWNYLEKNKDTFEFFKKIIRFRKNHKIIVRDGKLSNIGFPSISFHGVKPFEHHFSYDSHYLGVMYAGFREKLKKDEIIYIAINTYWEPLEIELPELMGELHWKIVVDTSLNKSFYKIGVSVKRNCKIDARTVMIFMDSKSSI